MAAEVTTCLEIHPVLVTYDYDWGWITEVWNNGEYEIDEWPYDDYLAIG